MMKAEDLTQLLLRLASLPYETEWAEFKRDNTDPVEIGEYLSAISNSAALHGKEVGFVVWGIADGTHELVGTRFRPRGARVGTQELESWLSCLLVPRINFRIHEIELEGRTFVLFEIPAAGHMPVRFKDTEFVRVGSYKKKLRDYPEKERELWASFGQRPAFEKEIAQSSVPASEILSLLDHSAYFDLTGQRFPEDRDGILQKLESETFIIGAGDDRYDITNLGAILLAKDLHAFEHLRRKAVRVVLYRGANRVETIREQLGRRGYAPGFAGLVSFINDSVVQNEVIGEAFRSEVRIYPEVAIRELVANALIHQDFTIMGTGPMVELFQDRIEITSPGLPLIDVQRFLDAPPQSRNDLIASFMRRIHVCEERGSGIDKVINAVETSRLPAPDFSVIHQHTRAVLYAYKKLNDMSRADRVRACYQHAGLQYVSNHQMTNSSLRTRFSIKDENYSIASRIIAESLAAGLIKPHDPDSRSRKHARYVPFWA
jgi:ATP-dependent DNA helicase RecG